MNNLIERYVDQFRFTNLFVEALGWDRPRGTPRTIQAMVGEESLTLTEAASYRGITVWTCPHLPDSRAQRLIDREVRKASDERLIIFHDGTRQEWCWPQTKDAQGAGSPRLILHRHSIGQPNPALAQRLEQIRIGLNEDDVSVVEVLRRLRRAFDADQVTRKFYVKFKTQHDNLCRAIRGITVGGLGGTANPEVNWYGSLLMNRVMFIYFMQKKGFLDGDLDYLRNRLEQIRRTERADAPGTFYDFYKHFLLPLFHHGLGHPSTSQSIHDPQIAALVGDIPYVNGGIFSVHPIEAAHDIAIDDSAFELLFDFLDDWQWHLDDRPTGNPNEINPDVLGYIFEQFINNKQQGAYYTKEDVTAYMTDNTLIPVFLDRLQNATGVNPWLQVARQPDRYVWGSLTHGCRTVVPDAVQEEAGALVRPTWDGSRPSADLALPGESWWEVNQRRARSEELTRLIGETRSTDQAVSQNLDIHTLALDVIDSLDSPEDVLAAWRLLTDIKILDPTCGSGAFLFSALSVLQTLYTAVLDAARLHQRATSLPPLRNLVAEADEHGSTDYFILKHAAINNLYGVDLMPEAVEIARLRLFLKLIAQVTDREDIEPLPDLEFNIRPGNVLVGAVDINDVAVSADVESAPLVDEVSDRAAEAATVYRLFSNAQVQGDADTIHSLRVELRSKTDTARAQLNAWWFKRFQQTSGIRSLEQYVDTHSPFHWNIEFPEVFAKNGGFDVVIGNPPYLDSNHVNYHYEGFATDNCPDIYAPCTERAASLLRPEGRLAFIVPHSLVYSSRFASLRTVLEDKLPVRWVSSFARIPASLFGNEVRVRNTIVIGRSGGSSGSLSTSRCHRWVSDYRPYLMTNIKYIAPRVALDDKWPMIDEEDLDGGFLRIEALGLGTLGGRASKTKRASFTNPLYYKTTAYAYVSAFIDIPPVVNADGSPGQQTEMGDLWFESSEDRDVAYALSVSRLMYAWWRTWGDDMHVTQEVLRALPIGPHNLSDSQRQVIAASVPQLRQLQKNNLTVKKNAGKEIGNWDLAAVREQIDIHEQRWLAALGLDDLWPVVVATYSAANPRTD